MKDPLGLLPDMENDPLGLLPKGGSTFVNQENQSPEYLSLIGIGYTDQEAKDALAAPKGPATFKEIREYAGTPTPKATGVKDFITRVVPESMQKTAIGMVTFPYEMVKSFEPASQSWYRGQYSEALHQAWEAVGHNIKGFAEFLGKGIGNNPEDDSGFARFSWQKFKDAWQTDPIGSIVGLAALYGLKRGKADTAKREFVENLPKEVKTDLIENFLSLSELPPDVLTKALEQHAVPKSEIAKVQEAMAEVRGEPSPTLPVDESLLKDIGKTTIEEVPKVEAEPIPTNLDSLISSMSADVSAKIGNVTMPDGAIFLKGKQPGTGSRFSFDDPITETRFQQAQGVPKEAHWSKVKEWFSHVWADATRTFENLPRGPEFAQLQFDLLRLMKQKSVTSDKALRMMQGITIDIKDPALYDTFRRKVILDDLRETLEKGKEIPFGFTEDSLKAEIGKLDTAIAGEPKLQQALDTRKKVWDAIKADYTNAMKDIGFDVSERFKNEAYFRHQVLDYARADSSLKGTGHRVKTPTSRGFLKKREGSGLDINTDYLQAEWSVMAQMLHDIETAKVIKSVDANYNIAEKVKAEAKKQGVEDWHDLIPEGYTEWQPRQGQSFYMTDSIPAKMAEELHSGALQQLGLTVDDLRQTMAVGGKRKEFIVKEEVAMTLDNLNASTPKSVIAEGSKSLLNGWKVWQLISPRRMFKYNLRNLTGDADAAFVGNPKGFTKSRQALSELYDVFVGDKPMTQTMRDWYERGGMSSTLQFQEIGDINNLKIFKGLADEHGGSFLNIPKKAWDGYWKAARMTTDFREAVGRYANYLDYLDQLQKGNGTPKNYGASMPEEINALKDIKDKAYWLSNDLLGAYDRVSVMGNVLRNHLIPFWSWKEVNFKRYIQFAKNAAEDGTLATKVGIKALGTLAKSPYTAYRVGKFLIKATALWSGLQVYNNLFWPDEEDSLPLEEKNRPHIILGKTEEGKVLNFNRIGSLGDFLQWFGLDAAPKHVDALFKGTMTLTEIAQDMVKSPINVVASGITPYIKTPMELVSGRTYFPDLFQPRTIRDRGLYLAQSLGLDNEYRMVSGLPSKGYGSSISKMFLYETDPGQSAYGDVYEMKNRFLKKIGKSYDGFMITPKGNALYNIKLAIRYNDENALQKAMEEYATLGGTNKGLKQSIKMMHPLSGLSKKEQAAFVEQLDSEDITKLEKAITFYETVLKGGK